MMVVMDKRVSPEGRRDSAAPMAAAPVAWQGGCGTGYCAGPMLLSCLHTADSNVDVFDAALRELGRDDVRLQHVVRADLLDRAEREGGLTAAIVAETAAVLGGLAGDVDAVLLTCSTVGPAVVHAKQAAVPVLRVDAALARQAVRE